MVRCKECVVCFEFYVVCRLLSDYFKGLILQNTDVGSYTGLDSLWVYDLDFTGVLYGLETGSPPIMLINLNIDRVQERDESVWPQEEVIS